MPHYLFSLLLAMCLTFSLPSLSAQEQSASSSQDTLLARQLLDTAQIRMNAGKYQDAIKCIDSAGILYERTLGKESGKYAAFLAKKGTCLYFIGTYDLALDVMNQALEIQLSLLGIDHLDVAASYGTIGSIYAKKSDFDKSILFLNKALQIQLKSLNEEHSVIANSYHSLSNTYYSKDQLDSAFYYQSKALQIRLKILGEEHLDIAHSYLSLGNIHRHYSYGDYEKAMLHYEKALMIFQKHFGEAHPFIAQCYQNIGIVYFEKGAYDQAISYGEKALQLQLNFLGEAHLEVALLYNTLAINYDKKFEFEQAITLFNKAIHIISTNFGAESHFLGNIYMNVGVLYSRREDYNNAVLYQQKALRILQKVHGTNSSYLALNYNNLGTLYNKMNDFDNTIASYKTAIALSNDISIKTMCYRNLGNSYLYKRQEIDTAIFYYKKAIAAIPSNDNSFEALASAWKSFRLLGKVYLTKFDKNNEQESLYQARTFLIKSIQTIDLLRNGFDENGAKESLLQNTYSVYEAILIADLILYDQTDSLSYLQEAFQYVSRVKSQLLYEALQESKALHFAGLPEELLQQEYHLRLDITQQEKQKQELLKTNRLETDSTMLQVNSKLFDLKQQYEALKKRFETDYSDYYQLKYNQNAVDATEIQQKLLQPGQVMVEYFISTGNIFMFVLRPDTLIVHDVKKDFPLEDWVSSLRDNIYKNRTTGATAYAEAAYHLYQKLILPIKSLLPEQVIIIPDGILGYVPFEALLTEKPERAIRFNSHAYLLKEHQISYCYSATLLREMQQKKSLKNPTGTLLAVAPFYTGDTTLLANLFAYDETTRKDLAPLQHSGEEVYRISKLWKGEVLTGADATEEKFTSQAGNYKVLHLATHGRADERVGDYSFLAFSEIKDSVENELLYVRDLYNMQLNADLVVLSACETGLGKLSRGEGIISLARAFAYAGAKSIVTTLWSVDDAKTKDLMVDFYRNLKKGMTKDAALRQAKLDYLQSHTNPGDAHPFYWAGFAPIGDMRALPK